jgi:hypothetical protein
MIANWLVIAGFLLLALGWAMRTILMMRASDTIMPGAHALHGRGLLRQYHREFPRSATPLLARSMLIAGSVLLLAGLATEATR